MKKAGNKLDVETILRAFQLKYAKSYLAVLSILVPGDVAVAYPAMVKKIKNINRATLYRALFSLEAKGAIHKIFDLKGVVHYTISSFDQNSARPRLYLYFNCLACRKIFYLNEPDSPLTLFAAGFQAIRFILCINGTCPKCNKKRL
jgi:Fur family ferric uptake transcriptional regulator